VTIRRAEINIEASQQAEELYKIRKRQERREGASLGRGTRAEISTHARGPDRVEAAAEAAAEAIKRLEQSKASHHSRTERADQRTLGRETGSEAALAYQRPAGASQVSGSSAQRGGGRNVAREREIAANVMDGSPQPSRVPHSPAGGHYHSARSSGGARGVGAYGMNASGVTGGEDHDAAIERMAAVALKVRDMTPAAYMRDQDAHNA
jgi:hypothetical protein